MIRQNIRPAIVFAKEFKLLAWRRRALVKFT